MKHDPQSPEVIYLSPDLLTVHPALADFPGLSDDQIAALENSIKEFGVLVPLVLTDDNQVIDGRAKLHIAVQLELPSVPVIYRAESDPLAYAIESAVNRRQLSRSAIAFVLFEQHPELAAQHGAKAGRPKKSAQVAPISEPASFTTLSKRYQVDRKDFTRLLEMRAAMSEEEWTGLRHVVLFEEVPLGRAYAGNTIPNPPKLFTSPPTC
jgi:hypothetical protein